MSNDFDFGRLSGTDFFLGGLGSLVGLKWVPGATFRERLFNFVCGTLCAAAITPALADWLQMWNASARGALSFAVGGLSLSLISELLKILAALSAEFIATLRGVKWADIIRGWLKRRG